MKIAILGGTFNPPHLGHIRVAEGAIHSLQMDKILFVPCSIPPHKSEIDLLAAHHRLTMTQLAIANEPKFEVLSFEIERQVPSYSIDTVRYLSAQHPRDQIFFILGSDNFNGIGQWHGFHELIQLCEFLVIERPGYPIKVPPLSSLQTQVNSLRYIIIQAPTLPISSSQIRQLIREGKDVSRLLSPSVYQYIQTHHLYQTS